MAALIASAVVLSLAAMFHRSLMAHVDNSKSAWQFNDDAQQQIWPFLRYRDPALFADDYLADYQLGMNPIGFTALYRLSAPLVDPRVLSKVVPYLLLLVLLGAAGMSAWRLGGPAAAWVTLALCLSTDVYLAEAAGGLPRAFGFSLIAVAAAALVFGRPYWLALAACLGAAFYYPIAVLNGVALAFAMLFPSSWTGLGESWSVRRRLSLVVATGALCGLIALPGIVGVQPYGRPLGPSDVLAYPEAGEGGRLGGHDVVRRLPPGDAFDSAWRWARLSLTGAGDPWSWSVRELGRRYEAILFPALMLVVMGGVWRLAREQSAVRRLLLLPASGFGAYALAWVLLPQFYVPERYVKFSIPVALAILVPVGLGGLMATRSRQRDHRWLTNGWTLGTCGMLLLLIGGRGSADAGLLVRVPDDARAMYAFLSRLPPDALIAGWPRTMDAVPYLAGRSVLLSHETHLPFHEQYVQETRRRMTALIDAYFAADASDLIALREQYGVTHLVVDRRHYEGAPPRYFQPFDEIVARHGTGGRAVLGQIATAGIFENGAVAVLDLALIKPSSMTRGPQFD